MASLSIQKDLAVQFQFYYSNCNFEVIKFQKKK